MAITLNAWTIIFLFFSFHGMLLTFFLLLGKTRWNYIPNRWAALLTFCFSILLLIYSAYWNRLTGTEAFIHLNYTYWPITFVLGPILYLYLRSQLVSNPSTSYLHFIPALLVFIIGLPFFLKNSVEKMAFFEAKQQEAFLSQVIINLLIISSVMQLTYYVYQNWKLIRNVEESTLLSSVNRELQPWITRLHYAFVVYVSCYVLYYLLIGLLGLPVVYDYFLSLIMAFMIYYIGFKAYQQPHLFKTRASLELAARQHSAVLISSEESSHYRELLLNLMEQESPYLEEDLKLGDLAKRLDLNGHQLSYFLNKYLGVNFNDFINHYRIERAKAFLEEKDQKVKIMTIAYESGFNSKTAFYEAFKKHTGMTPSVYKKEYQRTSVNVPDS